MPNPQGTAAPQHHRSLGDHAEISQVEALLARVVSFRKCACEIKAPQFAVRTKSCAVS